MSDISIIFLFNGMYISGHLSPYLSQTGWQRQVAYLALVVGLAIEAYSVLPLLDLCSQEYRRFLISMTSSDIFLALL